MYFQSSKHYHHAHWINAHMDFNVTEGNCDSLTENTLIYTNILNSATSQVITAVRLCLPLPLSPHPYMVLPVSQSLLVQSVSALS